jgi:L-aspartate-alpha-decarboxylase
MEIEILKSKLHRATVTQTLLEYEGSVSIDTELIKAARMHPYEKVDIFNINNGARFSTYVIPGGPGEICLNGAAARLAVPGDKIIIAAYARVSEQDADGWKPAVVLLGDGNRIQHT